jgi:hypothetical protein
MKTITDFIRSQYENGDITYTDAVASLIELGYDLLVAECLVADWGE